MNRFFYVLWTRNGSVGVSPTSVKVQNWNYNNSGNWTSTTKNTTTENRQHSASVQVTQIGNNAATHDAKGNLTAYEINGKEYEVDYDLDNRIIKADIDGDDVEYRYDAFIRKEGSTKTALIWWANSEKHRRLVGVLDRSVATCPVGVKAREASLNQCAEYKHSSGQAAIQNDLFAHPSRLNAVIARAVDGSKSKLQWYHKNYLDHVYAVSDDDGDLLEHYRYTAFGEVTIYNATGVQQSTTQINNQILWNTRRRDELTGYYMYKFRHYSAELGRWPSRDPIEEDGGVNLYGFVGNDGVNGWDKLGLITATRAYLASEMMPTHPDLVPPEAKDRDWEWQWENLFIARIVIAVSFNCNNSYGKSKVYVTFNWTNLHEDVMSRLGQSIDGVDDEANRGAHLIPGFFLELDGLDHKRNRIKNKSQIFWMGKRDEKGNRIGKNSSFTGTVEAGEIDCCRGQVSGKVNVIDHNKDAAYVITYQARTSIAEREKNKSLNWIVMKRPKGIRPKGHYIREEK